MTVENLPVVEETPVDLGITERAVNPRTETTPEPVVETQPVAETTEVVEPPVENPPKPRKTAEEVLKGRVGHLTKTVAQREQEANDWRTKYEAAEALLAAGKTEDTPTPTAQTPPGNKTYTEADFQLAVQAKAEADAFNKAADGMYNAGAEKFQDWKDTVDTLVASGFMNKDLLDAALAVDGGEAVLHHLGTNLDEAERINTLSPVKKTAELTKLSLQLNTPASVPVSNAPAPIRPVNGNANPQIDLQRAADEGDMKSWVAARAKQGSRWAQPRQR